MAAVWNFITHVLRCKCTPRGSRTGVSAPQATAACSRSTVRLIPPRSPHATTRGVDCGAALGQGEQAGVATLRAWEPAKTIGGRGGRRRRPAVGASRWRSSRSRSRCRAFPWPSRSQARRQTPPRPARRTQRGAIGGRPKSSSACTPGHIARGWRAARPRSREGRVRALRPEGSSCGGRSLMRAAA